MRHWLMLLVASSLSTAGCKSLVEERCEEICACEKCSDFGEEDCDIATEGSLEVAAAYGCDEEADAYLECELESYVCIEEQYDLPGGMCPNETSELDACMSDASQRAPGPVQAF
jgi:hypothetical protein